MELLRDRSKEFEDAGVRIMAASRDSAWSHVAWIQALDLNFPLLSDWNGDAVRGFGIARDYRGMKDVAQRAAFGRPPSEVLRRSELGPLRDVDARRHKLGPVCASF